MAQDILFTLGIEGDTEFLSQINKVINSVNSAFSTIKMPSLPDIGSITPKIDLTNFNVAQASVGELEKAYDQLRADFVQGGDTTLLTQVNRQLQALNRELSNTQEKAGKKPFDIATASAGELQKELSRLQRTFVSGMDTRQIVAVRDRLRETRIEMGQISGQSFTQRLRQAFTESLQDATNWQQRVLEIAGGNIIANLFEKVGQGVINAGKYAINSAGQFESLRASLNVIAGSDGLGGMLFDQFQKLASKSPFNFDDVGEQGTKLLAMGIPIADVTDRLSRIGDVAAGVGREKLPSIVYAYGQIKSQGKAMAGDLSQFINAGVPIIEVLAETLKKPQSEIKNLASTGKISFKDIDTALLAMTNSGGKFFQMMQTQSNTFEGLWSSMEDSFQLLAASIGQEMLPIVKNIVIGITDAVSAVTDFISGTKAIENKQLQEVLTAMKAIAGMSFDAISDTFSAMAKNIGLTVIAFAGLTVAINAATIAEQINIGVMSAGNVLRSIRQFLLNQGAAIALLGIGAYIRETIAMFASNAAITTQIALRTILNLVTGNWVTILVASAGVLMAAYAAYQIYNNESEKDAAFSKDVIDAKQQLSSEYIKERTQLDGLFGVLNNEKSSREDQVKAAKAVITNYKDLLPKYVDEEMLLRKGSAAIADRNVILEELRRKTLETIASNVKAQAMEGITTQLVKLEQAQQIFLDFVASGDRSKLEKLNKASELGLISDRLVTAMQSTMFSDKSVSEAIFEESENNIKKLKNSANELNSTWGSTINNLLRDTKGVDFTSGFNLGAVSNGAADAKKSVDILQGSMEALKQQLKDLEDAQAKTTVAGSSGYLQLQDKINGVKEKIKEVELLIAQRGLGRESLSLLNLELKQVRDNLEKASPNSDIFQKSAVAANELELKIKAIQDRIKLVSLTPGSMEFLNFQVSKVTEQLNKQPSGSGLIPGLIAQSKELTDKIRDLKIEYGLEPPRNSLSGINNSISELQKKLSETTDNVLLKSITKDVVALEKSARQASGQLAIMKAVAEGKATESTGIIRANPVDYAKYVQDLGAVIRKAQELRKEIDKLEASTSLTVDQLLSLEGKKAALAEMEKTLPSGYQNVNTVPTDLQLPTAVSTVFASSIAPATEGIDSFKESVRSASTEYASFLGLSGAQTEVFAKNIVTMFDQIQSAIENGMSQGIGNAAFAFGEGIGNMIMGMGSFEDAVTASLFALSQAFLVEIPKAIGMIMIQSAVGMMIESAGLFLPAALPLLLAGIALVGGSGVASGILGGLQKKRQKEQEGKKEIPNVNQAFGGSTTGGKDSAALGMSSQSADKPVLTNVINITMPVVGVDGIILSTLQSQQIIQQQLK